MVVKRTSQPVASHVARNPIDGRRTVSLPRAMLSTVTQELKPRQTTESPWGGFLSPVEGSEVLGIAKELLQGVIDSVPEGQRVPPKALEAIDATFSLLKSNLPTNSKTAEVEPRTSELIMTLIAPDRDSRRVRVDPDVTNAENRSTYLALQKTIAGLRRR